MKVKFKSLDKEETREMFDQMYDYVKLNNGLSNAADL